MKLLKTRQFLPFFIAMFGGTFNDSLIRRSFEMLIAFKGLSGSLSPEVAIFLLLAVFMSPFFICSAFAGYLADIKPKEYIIKLVKFAELAVVLIAIYALFTDSLWFSVLAVVGLGIHSAFFGPIKYSLPPQHLKAEELMEANGLIEAGTNVGILLGTILGSLAVGFSGGIYVVSALALSFSIIGILSSFYIPSAKPANDTLIVRKSTVGLLKRIYFDRNTYLLSIGISWFWTLGAILISLFALIVKDVLNGPDYYVTIFFTVFSIGVGVGSLLCGKILNKEIVATWVPISALGMAISLFGFYLLLPSPIVSSLPEPLDFPYIRACLILLCLFSTSVFAGIFIVPLYGLLQRSATLEERSQVVAGNNILNALFMVLGSVVISLLFKLGVSVSFVLLVLVLFNIFAGIYACLLLPDQLFRSVLRIVFKSFFRAEVSGLENFAKVGPKAVIIANHLSFLDAVMLAAYCPERVTFAVNTEISKLWWMKPAMACFDLIPIDPANPMAIRMLIDRVKQNKKVVIFPEGRITVTGALMKVYEGPALIAEKADAPIIPIRLDGFQYSFFSRAKNILQWKFFPKLSMTVCEPVHLKIDGDLASRERREALGTALYDLMTNMIYETNRRGPTLLHSIREVSNRVVPSKLIVRDALGGAITYKMLMRNSYVAAQLLKNSSSTDSRVGLLLPNGVSMLVFFFAFQWARKVPALLNYSHAPEQLLSTCNVANLKSIVTSRKFIELGKLGEHISVLENSGVEVLHLEDLQTTFTKVDKFKAIVKYKLEKISASFRGVDYIPGSETDEAVVLFTSGSEGTPKGVVLSHGNLLNNIDQVTANIPLVSSDSVFNALPMFHSFGLTGGTLMPLIKGVSVYLYPSPLHYRIIPEVIYSESSTILFGTPTFLGAYANYAHPYDFFSLRYIFSGAERLSEAVRTQYNERFGIRIFEGYGATETSPVLAVNNPFYTKMGTVGRFVPGVEYRLDAIPGIEEGARLFVKGPNVMKGYLKIDQPGVLQPLESEWYDTGDIVQVDSQGFISIKGRAKRFAKIGGEMVSLTAIEQVLDAKWRDNQHSVIAIPDAKKGERLILFTTLSSLEKDQLFEALRSSGLSELSFPKEIRILNKLPVLGSGKVDVQELTKSI